MNRSPEFSYQPKNAETRTLKLENLARLVEPLSPFDSVLARLNPRSPKANNLIAALGALSE